MTQNHPYSALHGADADGLPYGRRDDRPGLLAITDALAMAQIEAMAAGTGFRLLDIIAVEDAPQRLDQQIDCDCALLFCDEATVALERLLIQIETLAIQKQMALIVVAPLDSIDLVYACLRSDDTHLLCAPGPADLIAAMVAVRDRQAEPTLHDFGRESESQRLQQLSEEVGRISRTLEALTQGRPAAAPSLYPGPRISDKASDYIGIPALSSIGSAPATPDLTAQKVRDLIRARRLRADLMPGDLFADPAWDMLLDLLAARLDHERVSVSSLCIASAVPPTTALRWIRTLTDRGLALRQADPHDGRRVFIALADKTVDALTQWFSASRRYLCG